MKEKDFQFIKNCIILTTEQLKCLIYKSLAVLFEEASKKEDANPQLIFLTISRVLDKMAESTNEKELSR